MMDISNIADWLKANLSGNASICEAKYAIE